MNIVRLEASDLDRLDHLMVRIKNGVPRAMLRAINRVLVSVRAEAIRAVRAEVPLPVKLIRPTFSMRKASLANLVGEVISSGRDVPLIHFDASPQEVTTPRPSGGVSATVKRSEGKKVLTGSFIAGMNSGHKGVFQRVSRPRFPIDELYGPSVPDVLDDDDVLPDVEDKALAKLTDRFRHEVDFLLSKV